MEFYPIAVHEIEADRPLRVGKYKVLATVSTPVIDIVCRRIPGNAGPMPHQHLSVCVAIDFDGGAGRAQQISCHHGRF